MDIAYATIDKMGKRIIELEEANKRLARLNELLEDACKHVWDAETEPNIGWQRLKRDVAIDAVEKALRATGFIEGTNGAIQIKTRSSK